MSQPPNLVPTQSGESPVRDGGAGEGQGDGDHGSPLLGTSTGLALW